jgi:uncharacterized protein
MRVFLDTNVIVSAAATRGLCADVMREVLVRHELVVSGALLDEVGVVLRDKIGVPPAIIADIIGFLREGAILAEPAPAADLPIRGPSDRALMSAAVNGKTDLFVTGDGELLGLSASGSLEIVSPRMFWEKVKGGTRT